MNDKLKYEIILDECKSAICETKKEIDKYKCEKEEVREFLNELKMCWVEEI